MNENENKTAKHPGSDISMSHKDPYVEKVSDELLHKCPEEIPFNTVLTEEEFEESRRLRGADIRELQGKKQKSAKRKKRFARVLLCVFCAALLFFGSITGGFLYIFGGYKPVKPQPGEFTDRLSPVKDSRIFSVLLLLDLNSEEKEEGFRNNSVMLLTADTRSMSFKLTSLVRETELEVPGHGELTLAKLCAFGSPLLICDTISYNFGIDVRSFVHLYPAFLSELTDGIGGITIPEIGVYEASLIKNAGVPAEAGTNVRADGALTAAYCRIIRGTDEQGRSQRQLTVMRQLITACLHTSPRIFLPLAKSLTPETESNISRASFFALSFRSLFCLRNEIETLSLPLPDTWDETQRDGALTVSIDIPENRNALMNFIFENTLPSE